jgi:DNA (cytosine-5)-methyltransferase 1
MNHASLFSGIGGFDLAAEWMGWTNVFNCEWEEFPRRVLKHHFPKAIQYGDIKELYATAYAGRVDILTGGFPCQPFSTAGKRAGTSDNRYLWPEMFRIIREARPTYVVAENVRGILSWNEGLVLDTVLSDLESEGYEVLPTLLPAASINAPHRRDRVWFVAYADHKGRSDGHGQVQGTNGEVRQRNDRTQPCDAGSGNATDADCGGLEGATKVRRDSLDVKREGIAGNASDTDSNRFQGGLSTDEHRQQRSQAAYVEECVSAYRQGIQFENFPTQPPVCGGDDGLPKELDGITFSKWRRESIKAYGNAIVPQVALQIFQAIQFLEDNKQNTNHDE